MQVDYFKDILVPVVGGLGIFMLGLEFMSNGIQNLAVNRMRALLARIAGTPIKGVLAGTLITGIIQSSTAMTVMVVGLVNSGVLGLRPAISVIMGANIGTTLGNGLIALPLGPLGLLLGGVFALVHVFAKNDRVKNIALACMGFALIFYGLNLMTGGLRPLRNIPEVMSAISSLRADNLLGVIYCILIAALITAMIHSSSATIGIVMGLGAAGVLGWQTAVAFSLGADLGTTITSWMASLNLSKNAKRAAYAHISFNIIGVAVMLPLFFPSMQLLTWAMGWFGGDPGVAVDPRRQGDVPAGAGGRRSVLDGLQHLQHGAALPVRRRVRACAVAHRAHLRRGRRGLLGDALPRPAQGWRARDRCAAGPAGDGALRRGRRLFLAIARKDKRRPATPRSIRRRIDILSRDIRRYTAAMFKPDMPHAQADLLASLIEEEDFTASLGETLFQVARRIERQPFSPVGRELVDATLDQIAERDAAHRAGGGRRAALDRREERAAVPAVHAGTLPELGADLPWEERGAILELLGSAERAFFLIDRIEAERRSVPRAVPADAGRSRRRRRSPGWARAGSRLTRRGDAS